MRKIKVFAHRGDMGSGPENTMEALDGAVEKGAGGVEIDIRMTKDGRIVVFHDEDLRRVTLGALDGQRMEKIRELSWEELKSVSLPFAGHLLTGFPQGGYVREEDYYLPENLGGRGDPRTSDVLSLDDFLSWLMKQQPDFLAEVEYKESGMMPRLAELLEKYGAASRCIVFSGERDKNREIQDWCRKNGKPAGLRLGANIRFLSEESLEEIRGYDLYEAGLNAGAFGEEEVKTLEERGILVFSNLGDVPSWWEALEEIQAAGLKTNCLGPYMAWRRARDDR